VALDSEGEDRVMSREVRRVPKDWSHPKDDRGSYRPLYDADYETEADAWVQGFMAWEGGKDPDRNETSCRYYWEWNSGPPEEGCYRPSWTDQERTHYQMYETTSEGTPISPVMPSPEELALWLTDNHANAGAGMTATYSQWLRVCQGHKAPSLIFSGGRIMSGVEGMEEIA